MHNIKYFQVEKAYIIYWYYNIYYMCCRLNLISGQNDFNLGWFVISLSLVFIIINRDKEITNQPRLKSFWPEIKFNLQHVQNGQNVLSLGFPANGFHVGKEWKMYVLLSEPQIWKFHVIVWQTTSKQCIKKRAARLFFRFYPIRSNVFWRCRCRCRCL